MSTFHEVFPLNMNESHDLPFKKLDSEPHGIHRMISLEFGAGLREIAHMTVGLHKTPNSIPHFAWLPGTPSSRTLMITLTLQHCREWHLWPLLALMVYKVTYNGINGREYPNHQNHTARLSIVGEAFVSIALLGSPFSLLHIQENYVPLVLMAEKWILSMQCS